MVRDADRRRRKYGAKISPEAVGQRIAELRPQMIRAHDEDFAVYTELEQRVRQVVQAAGVPTFSIPYYIIFAKQLCRIRDAYTSATRAVEAGILYQVWQQRGLDPALLVKVAEVVGVAVAPPPYVPPPVPKVFRLDEGMLDVDVLG